MCCRQHAPDGHTWQGRDSGWLPAATVRASQQQGCLCDVVPVMKNSQATCRTSGGAVEQQAGLH